MIKTLLPSTCILFRLFRLRSRLVAFSSFMLSLYHPLCYMSRVLYNTFDIQKILYNTFWQMCYTKGEACTPKSTPPPVGAWRIILCFCTLRTTTGVRNQITNAFPHPCICVRYPLPVTIRLVEVVPVLPFAFRERLITHITVSLFPFRFTHFHPPALHHRGLTK